MIFDKVDVAQKTSTARRRTGLRRVHAVAGFRAETLIRFKRIAESSKGLRAIPFGVAVRSTRSVRTLVGQRTQQRIKLREKTANFHCMKRDATVRYVVHPRGALSIHISCKGS